MTRSVLLAGLVTATLAAPAAASFVITEHTGTLNLVLTDDSGTAGFTLSVPPGIESFDMSAFAATPSQATTGEANLSAFLLNGNSILGLGLLSGFNTASGGTISGSIIFDLHFVVTTTWLFDWSVFQVAGDDDVTSTVELFGPGNTNIGPGTVLLTPGLYTIHAEAIITSASPDAGIPVDGQFVFELTALSVPAPSVVAVLGLGGLVPGRRRRRH